MTPCGLEVWHLALIGAYAGASAIGCVALIGLLITWRERWQGRKRKRQAAAARALEESQKDAAAKDLQRKANAWSQSQR